jgi:hypothetical protein
MAFDTVWTRFAEARMLNATLRGVGIPVAADAWTLGLLNLKAGADGTKVVGRDDVAEVQNAASYVRRPLGAATLSEPAGGMPAAFNAAVVEWPEAQEGWGEIVALGLFDDKGNLWAVSPSEVADRRTVRRGDRMTVDPGQFRLTGYKAP